MPPTPHTVVGSLGKGKGGLVMEKEPHYELMPAPPGYFNKGAQGCPTGIRVPPRTLPPSGGVAGIVGRPGKNNKGSIGSGKGIVKKGAPHAKEEHGPHGEQDDRGGHQRQKRTADDEVVLVDDEAHDAAYRAKRHAPAAPE